MGARALVVVEKESQAAFAASPRGFEGLVARMGAFETSVAGDTGTHMPKQQAQALAERAASDFDAFYEAREAGASAR